MDRDAMAALAALEGSEMEGNLAAVANLMEYEYTAEAADVMDRLIERGYVKFEGTINGYGSYDYNGGKCSLTAEGRYRLWR